MYHNGVWENRAIYVYYSELVFEISALSVDFCHHLHMLVCRTLSLTWIYIKMYTDAGYMHTQFTSIMRSSFIFFTHTVLNSCAVLSELLASV